MSLEIRVGGGSSGLGNPVRGRGQKCLPSVGEVCIFSGITHSTKTIRLFTLNFYEVIVDLAFGLINYHLIDLELNLELKKAVLLKCRCILYRQLF